MTDLRTAAQQALEALEDFGMKHYENTGEVLHRDVYESLKAALAEPVGVLRTLVQIHPDGTETWREDPVWIAPPRPKPLTEEEIQAAWDSVDMRHPRGNGTRIAFARAIERAHGITP